jgi:hypothetical protein
MNFIHQLYEILSDIKMKSDHSEANPPAPKIKTLSKFTSCLPHRQKTCEHNKVIVTHSDFPSPPEANVVNDDPSKIVIELPAVETPPPKIEFPMETSL